MGRRLPGGLQLRRLREWEEQWRMQLEGCHH